MCLSPYCCSTFRNAVNGKGQIIGAIQGNVPIISQHSLVGDQVGNAITRTIPISGGLFTVELDFGSGIFTGEARWLGIRVKCSGV